MFFLALLEAMRDRLHGVEGPALLNHLEAEHGNVQAALAWTVAEGEAELALRMTNAFWRFWWMRSHLGQGRLWIERVLALPDPHGAALAHRPRALVAAGYFARIQGDHEQAIAFGEEAMAAAREQGDSSAMAAARFLLGLIAFDRGDLETARTHHQVALILEREINDAHGLALQLTCLGEIAITDGDLGGARTRGEEALAIWKGRGDAWGTAWALIQLGKVARAEGAPARAIALLRDSLAANEQLGDKEIAARATFELAAIAGGRGEFSLATRLYGSVAALREAIGAPLAPVDRRRYEQAVAVARSALTEEAFAAAWHEGYSQPPENSLCDVLDSGT
jgi:tetratricopeptide (TPR) repeat protein